MTLANDEFIRRFLLHVLPSGFHRIRHYGLIANTGRKENLARARELLTVPEVELSASEDVNEIDTAEVHEQDATYICPECGAPMISLRLSCMGNCLVHHR